MTGPNDRPRAEESAPRSDQPSAPEDILERVFRGAGELIEYLRHYLQARSDAAKAATRAAIVRACIEATVVMTAAGLFIGAGVMMVAGIAAGLGEWTGRRWLGDLIAGVALVTVLVGGIWLRVTLLRRKWRRDTILKYEQRKENQRQRFGHDVEERAGLVDERD